ncbi:MAG: DUF4351 domain-containing protein [Magnetococcales bacterium]|nr:DUF4351 domain-containing protein [Magnetococcales bacterium]
MSESDNQSQKNEFDTPWKEILRTHFEDFLAFFLPEAHDGIEWRRGYEFLDKELASIAREAEIGDRRMDKLVKVYQKDGVEYWVVIHVEIQGGREANYPERMFTYNYRTYDIKKRPVVSLAVLADDDINWRPTEYGYELWGTRVGFRFTAIKLLDYSEADLERSSNPFAVVVQAHLQAKKTKGKTEDRYQAKWKLIRSLYQRGYDRQKVIDLFRFIDWVLHLPREADERLMAEIVALEEDKKMPYISSVERIGEERGVLKGIEIGEQRGEKKGKADTLTRQLQRRFGDLPPWASQKIADADLATLENWSLRILDAPTLESVLADPS